MFTLINKKLQSVRREDGARAPPPAPNGKKTKKKTKTIKNKEESPKVILKPSAVDLNILLCHADSSSHTFSVTQINKYCSRSK